jgi:hypothetical protein
MKRAAPLAIIVAITVFVANLDLSIAERLAAGI